MIRGKHSISRNDALSVEGAVLAIQNASISQIDCLGPVRLVPDSYASTSGHFRLDRQIGHLQRMTRGLLAPVPTSSLKGYARRRIAVV